jgi:hypothetical protein
MGIQADGVAPRIDMLFVPASGRMAIRTGTAHYAPRRLIQHVGQGAGGDDWFGAAFGFLKASCGRHGNSHGD